MDWLNISVLYFQYFILVLARIVTMVSLVPIYGSGAVPTQTKIGFSLLLSFIIFPIVVRDFPPIPEHLLLFFGLMFREVLVGVLMGLVTSIIFAAVQLSGQIFGMQIGFGIVNVIDPLSDLQISILGQFEFLVAIMLFLAVGGHHLLIAAMANSYLHVPLGAFAVNAPLTEQVTQMLGKMFDIAFKVGFPMIAAIFLINIVMGVIARTVPQMNIFIVGLPLNIFVGLIVMGLSIVYVTFLLKNHFTSMFTDLLIMFEMAGGK